MVNVPSSAAPITDKVVAPVWYRFFADLLRLVNANLLLINTNLSTARGDDTAYTIATGAVTITKFGLVRVDTEAAAATDDLDTINGQAYGAIIVVVGVNSGRDVTLKDGTGNLVLAGDFTLTNTADTITLMGTATGWLEMSRSDNA